MWVWVQDKLLRMLKAGADPNSADYDLRAPVRDLYCIPPLCTFQRIPLLIGHRRVDLEGALHRVHAEHSHMHKSTQVPAMRPCMQLHRRNAGPHMHHTRYALHALAHPAASYSFVEAKLSANCHLILAPIFAVDNTPMRDFQNSVFSGHSHMHKCTQVAFLLARLRPNLGPVCTDTLGPHTHKAPTNTNDSHMYKYI